MTNKQEWWATCLLTAAVVYAFCMLLFLSGCSFMPPRRGECVKLTDGFYKGCYGKASRKAAFSDAAIVEPLICEGAALNSQYLILKSPFGWEKADCSLLDQK